MFTGIVREMGRVVRIGRSGEVRRLRVSCRKTCEGVSVGDSVSVNGVCLTAVNVSAPEVEFDVMAETLRRTALSRLGEGDPVNLEPSLKASGGVEGHFVLGHIDCVGTVSKAAKSGGQFELEVKYPDRYDPLVVEKGSVAVDGVSLTVGRAARGAFSVYAIPHTLKETTLGTLRVKDGVNLEFDIIGKHIAKLELSRRTGITEEFLRLHGF